MLASNQRPFSCLSRYQDRYLPADLIVDVCLDARLSTRTATARAIIDRELARLAGSALVPAHEVRMFLFELEQAETLVRTSTRRRLSFGGIRR